MRHPLLLSHGSAFFRLVVSDGGGRLAVKSDDGAVVEFELSRLADGCCEVKRGERRQLVHYAVRGDVVHLQVDGAIFTFHKERHEVLRQQGAVNDDLRAPMPGQITGIFVQPGQAVALGEPLYGLEAMKMESLIKAPLAGRVSKIHARAGEQVEGGALVVELEA